VGIRTDAETERRCLELAGLVPAPVVAVDEDADEKAFQSDVIREAKRAGWKVYHTFDSRKSTKGFPDLVLAKDRVLYRELKTNTGETTVEQEGWLEVLKRAGADAGVWRPRDWPAIERELSRPAG
jgi:hypothetical protein